jgi:hypothetical protein
MVADGAEFSVCGPKTAYIIDTLRTEGKRNRASREADKASLICGLLLLILISLFTAEKSHAERKADPANVEISQTQTSSSWRLA